MDPAVDQQSAPLLPTRTQPYDVVVVGAGLIGAAVAVALARSALRILVLEARANTAPGDDARTLAMSYGSRLILERLGVWTHLESATPIESIHVSQRGGFGRALLSTAGTHLPALGYAVRHADVQQALGKALASSSATLRSAAEVLATQQASDAVNIDYRVGGSTRAIAARLLIVADGGTSAALRQAQPVRAHPYEQHAVVGLVAATQLHANRAYERFAPEGPVALLPFEQRYALVWTTAPAAADRLMELAPERFLGELQEHFGDRAGRFTAIEARARFPLALRYAPNPAVGRTVMLGNAAQTLHPVAAQGFNLGLRDAWELRETVLAHGAADAGAAACLARYRSMRRPDRLRGIALTHSLTTIFSNDSVPLRVLRGGALSLLDLAPAAKRAFIQRMIFGAAR